jgi:hypothetical protein
MYRVTLDAHFEHYSGERRDVRLCKWVDASDAERADARARSQASAEGYTVDATVGVAFYDGETVVPVSMSEPPQAAGGTSR